MTAQERCEAEGVLDPTGWHYFRCSRRAKVQLADTTGIPHGLCRQHAEMVKRRDLTIFRYALAGQSIDRPRVQKGTETQEGNET